ncbi:MAG: glutaminyl-peptide cyclotransferase [Luminiphilus sp.]|nr:glutaminyl-peptide cyclotransferase [Luminiphilus sp.]
MILILRLFIVIFLALSSQAFATDPENSRVNQKTAVVVESRPMERRNFTQGLYIFDSELYVSSGQYGKSAVRVYAWPTMTLNRETTLPKEVFAEGLTLLAGRLWILTWRSGQLLILDPSTLEILTTGKISGEGWGITHNASTLWLSNGSSRLHSIDLNNGGKTAALDVTLNGEPLARLNELEWINGKIWANVWLTNTIVIIDPETGIVTDEIALDGVLREEEREASTDVLNGIAQDPKTGAIWITGKRWPKIFRIELENTN